jgi:hypothetical protein
MDTLVTACLNSSKPPKPADEDCYYRQHDTRPKHSTLSFLSFVGVAWLAMVTADLLPR